MTLESHASTPAEILVNESQEKMQKFLIEAEDLKKDAVLKAKKILKSPAATPSCGCNKSDHPEPSTLKKSESAENVLVFVSLSMPKDSLRTLYAEAEKQNSVLILRGLKNNSFKETAEVLKELKIAASIDPTLFEKYHISAVPTFVMVRDSEPLFLMGNVSLSYANQKFKDAL